MLKQQTHISCVIWIHIYIHVIITEETLYKLKVYLETLNYYQLFVFLFFNLNIDTKVHTGNIIMDE